jgi:hypothetical protein
VAEHLAAEADSEDSGEDAEGGAISSLKIERGGGKGGVSKEGGWGWGEGGAEHLAAETDAKTAAKTQKGVPSAAREWA